MSEAAASHQLVHHPDLSTLVVEAIDSGLFSNLVLIYQKFGRGNCHLVDGSHAIHYACLKGKIGFVKGIVEDNPEEIEAMDREGFRPIHKAVIGENPEIVALLIGLGANFNVQSNLGQTPLHLAVLSETTRRIACMNVLLDCEADVYIQNAIGTFLHVAVQSYPIGSGLTVLRAIFDHPSLWQVEDGGSAQYKGRSILCNLITKTNRDGKDVSDIRKDKHLRDMFKTEMGKDFRRFFDDETDMIERAKLEAMFADEPVEAGSPEDAALVDSPTPVELGPDGGDQN